MNIIKLVDQSNVSANRTLKELGVNKSTFYKWYKRYIRESSVYRILRERGLIPAPQHIVLSATDEFHRKTSYVNETWQIDFTYFKIIGWGGSIISVLCWMITTVLSLPGIYA